MAAGTFTTLKFDRNAGSRRSNNSYESRHPDVEIAAMFAVRRSVYVLAVLSLIAGPVMAEPVTVTATGRITRVNGPAAAGNGVFSVGDTFTYSLTFNEADLAEPGPSSTTSAITAFSGQVGSYLFGGTTGNAFTRNDGVVSGAFGGSPYDQLSISHNNLAVNQAGFGLNRSDFSVGAPVAGFALRSAAINAAMTDLSFLQNNNLSAAAFFALSDPSRLPSAQLSMFFMNNAFGQVNLSVDGAFDTMTVSAVPLPAAAWLLLSGIGGMGAFARRKRTA